MICRTGVQDRLKIRLDALVELTFKNFPVCCCALVRSPLGRACGMSAALSTILARAANVPDLIIAKTSFIYSECSSPSFLTSAPQLCRSDSR